MNTPQPQFPTAEQLANVVRAAVTQALSEDRARETTENPRARGRFYEGKPWDVRTSDGRINLGNYAVSSQRWTFEWAYEHLLQHTDEDAVDPEEAWELSGAILALSDRVQSEAYGRDFQHNRMTPSHLEAQHWVQWVIGHLHPWARDFDVDDAEAVQTWCDSVATEATSMLRRGGENTSTYFQNLNRVDDHGRPQKRKAEKAPEKSGGELTDVHIKAFLDGLVRVWDKPDKLANFTAQVEGEYGATVVSIDTPEEGGVIFHHPPLDGADARPVRDFLRERQQALGGTSDTSEAKEQAAPAAEPAAEPSTAPTGNGQQEDTRGYHPNVFRAIQQIMQATNDAELREVYLDFQNRDQALFDAHVSVRRDPDTGEVFFGSATQDGYAQVPLRQVFGAIRRYYSTVATTAPSAPAAQASPPAPQGNAPVAASPESPASPAPSAPSETASVPSETAEAPETAEADETAAISQPAVEDSPSTPTTATPSPAEAPPAPGADSATSTATDAQKERAQEIANAAIAESDPKVIQQHIDTATSEGLLTTLVSSPDRKGEGRLEALLSVNLRRKKRNADRADAGA